MIFLSGFAAMNYGLVTRFGVDLACIIGGTVLMLLAIVGAMRDA